MAAITSSPGNQNGVNSCVGWAVGYGFFTQQVRTKNIPKGIFSPLVTGNPNATPMSANYLYHYCLEKEYGDSKIDADVSFETAFEVIRERGVCQLSQLSDYRETPDPKAETTAADFMAWVSALPISPTDRQSIRSSLRQAPLPIGLKVSDAFFTEKFGTPDKHHDETWKCCRDNCKTLHAMLLIGWDDARHAYEIMNSLGTGWGNGGYLWIDYNFFEQIAVSVWKCSLEAKSGTVAELIVPNDNFDDWPLYRYCKIATVQSGKLTTPFDMTSEQFMELMPGNSVCLSASSPGLELSKEIGDRHDILPLPLPPKLRLRQRVIVDRLIPGDCFYALSLDLVDGTAPDGANDHQISEYWAGGYVVRRAIPVTSTPSP